MTFSPQYTEDITSTVKKLEYVFVCKRAEVPST